MERKMGKRKEKGCKSTNKIISERQKKKERKRKITEVVKYPKIRQNIPKKKRYSFLFKIS